MPRTRPPEASFLDSLPQPCWARAARSVGRADPCAAHMVPDGVWTRLGTDLEETGSALSMLSPSQVGSVATPGAASSAAPAVPREHCFGAGLCPWCMLTCGPDEHGRLDLAVGKYHQAQAEAARASCQLTMVEENCIMGGLRLMLLTCAMQVHNRGATAADQNTIGRLQVLGILPPTDSWNKVAGCAPPSPPGAPATAMETDDGAASEADKNKNATNNASGGRATLMPTGGRETGANPIRTEFASSR